MPDVKKSRGIVTMAFGREKYIEMAKWLGMSLRLNAPNLSSAVLTDSRDPELGEFFTHVISHRPEMGQNMYPKFFLDEFSPFDESLYIDTDCLVVNDLEDLWPAFAVQPVGILGWRYLTKFDTASDVDVPFVLEHFGLERLPKFNGGCYYFRRDPKTTEFFRTAKELLEQAGDLRIGCYPGGGFSDEPIFAIALALHNIPMISAGRKGMWTPLSSTGPIRLDVFRQRCSFVKEGVEVTPDIVHFPAGYRECLAYHREVWRLKSHFRKALPTLNERLQMRATGLLWQAKRFARYHAKRLLRGEPIEKMRVPGLEQ